MTMKENYKEKTFEVVRTIDPCSNFMGFMPRYLSITLTDEAREKRLAEKQAAYRKKKGKVPPVIQEDESLSSYPVGRCCLTDIETSDTWNGIIVDAFEVNGFLTLSLSCYAWEHDAIVMAGVMRLRETETEEPFGSDLKELELAELKEAALIDDYYSSHPEEYLADLEGNN